MPQLPAAQLEYLRDQHPGMARLEWYLAVAPYGCGSAKTSMFTALTTGAPTRGDMDIEFTSGAFPATCYLDSAQGAMTYAATTFDDAGQDFRDWQAPNDGTTIQGEALYVVVVTNDDDSMCWAWLGMINGPNTTIDVYSNSDCSTAGWAGANQAGKTPVSYVIVIAPNEGLTLWVDDDAYNEWDEGRVRIRRDCESDVMQPSVEGTTAVGAAPWIQGTIHVAENDDIDWDDDQYLTIPGIEGFREIWGVYQRIDDAGAGAVAFYKDYNVTYTAAGSPGDHLPPKANAGPPARAWIDAATGLATVEFVGSPDSYYTSDAGGWAGGTPHWWAFPGGTPAYSTTLGTCDAPVTVTWDTPGFYYVSLTVEDDNYQHGRVYVPVWIFEANVEEPHELEILSQDCDVDSGWRARFKVYDVDEDTLFDFSDNALVVLFTKTWFGDTETGVGGWCCADDEHYRDNIRFVGWIQGESLNFDHEAGTVEFEAVAHDGVMRRIPGFAFTVEDTAAPSDWYEMADLDVDRAMHHLLEYQSTVNQVCHVVPVGEGNTRTIPIQPFPDASLYDQAQEHLLKDAMCLLLSDFQGILRATQDPQFLDLAGRAGVDTVCTLSDANQDWMNELEEDKAHVPSAGLVRLGGFSGVTPLLAQAPGTAPLQQEADAHPDGCILVDAAEARRWAGQALAKINNPFPAVPLELPGYWPVFDPAFQEYVNLTIQPPADVRRQTWTDEPFIVREVSFGDLAANATAVTEITVEQATDWLDGEDVAIPAPPPPEPPNYPPVPIPSPLPEPEVLEEPDIVFVRTSEPKVYRTANWTDTPPIWADITGALTNINRIAVDQVNRYIYVVCDSGVWRGSVDDGAPAWVRIFDATALPADVDTWNDEEICVTPPDGRIWLHGAVATPPCTVCAGAPKSRPVLMIIPPGGDDSSITVLHSQWPLGAGFCCPDHDKLYYHSYLHGYCLAWNSTMVRAGCACGKSSAFNFHHIATAAGPATNYFMTNEGAHGDDDAITYSMADIGSTLIVSLGGSLAESKVYSTPGGGTWTDITAGTWHWSTQRGLDRDARVDGLAFIADRNYLYSTGGGAMATVATRAGIFGGAAGYFWHCSCYCDDTDQLFLACGTGDGIGVVLTTINGGTTWTDKTGAMGDLNYLEIRPVWTVAP